MDIKQAILKTFDAGSHTATIRLSGSAHAYLEGVTVDHNIPVAEMVPGRKLAVIFFDRYRVSEAVVVASW
ncbi:hypothetical protein ABFB09_01980 [Dehalogenimonas sp. THU2]|uniref:hypothetical protein n=1 Tax=Dehalogenimonas sp. THU2 TaxID=3151121 RepID=UPI0032189495